MKASPLLISWHNESTPIYSAHFEPHGKGRLATGGGDNNVRLWRVEKDGEERTVTYLTTLIKVGPQQQQQALLLVGRLLIFRYSTHKQSMLFVSLRVVSVLFLIGSHGV